MRQDFLKLVFQRAMWLRPSDRAKVSLELLMKFLAVRNPASPCAASLGGAERQQNETDSVLLRQPQDLLTAPAPLLPIRKFEEKVGFDVNDHAAMFVRM
jgi:hypothetical protein